jgi:hypothetical protein
MALKIIKIEEEENVFSLVFTIDRMNDAFMAQDIFRIYITQNFSFVSTFGIKENFEEELAFNYKCKNVINMLTYNYRDKNYRFQRGKEKT